MRQNDLTISIVFHEFKQLGTRKMYSEDVSFTTINYNDKIYMTSTNEIYSSIERYL